MASERLHPDQRAGKARRALVLGGTGVVGRAVLAELARAGVPTRFTYHTSSQRAAELEAGPGAPRAMNLDLSDLGAIRAFMDRLDAQGELPDVLIQCAAVASPARLEQLDDADFAHTLRVNCQSVAVICQRLAPHFQAARRGDVVLVGALDRTQTLPLPIAFATSQGALAALCMALAGELGPHQVRVNMVALGLLGSGLSERVGSSALYRDFQEFSALRRVGTPEEAARAIVWLALHNRYMTGKVMPVNGGI